MSAEKKKITENEICGLFHLLSKLLKEKISTIEKIRVGKKIWFSNVAQTNANKTVKHCAN